MARFRNAAAGQPVANWWDNGFNQIAFSRGNKGKQKIRKMFSLLTQSCNKKNVRLNRLSIGFIAINNDGYALSQNLQTGLPGGQYCDIISGNLENGRCTGTTITVGGDGRTQINISNSAEDPMIAIHVDAKL